MDQSPAYRHNTKDCIEWPEPEVTSCHKQNSTGASVDWCPALGNYPSTFLGKKINHLVVERLEDALQSLPVLSHAL